MIKKKWMTFIILCLLMFCYSTIAVWAEEEQSDVGFTVSAVHDGKQMLRPKNQRLRWKILKKKKSPLH